MELSWHPTKALTPGGQNLPVHFSAVHFFELVTPHSLYLLIRLTWKHDLHNHTLIHVYLCRDRKHPHATLKMVFFC